MTNPALAKRKAFDRTWDARLASVTATPETKQKALKSLGSAKTAMIKAYGGFTPEYVSAWEQIQRETDFAAQEVTV